METASRADVFRGSCLCGAVAFVVTDGVLYAGHCHCSECRKFSGSGSSAFVGVRAGGFHLQHGSENALGSFLKRESTRMRFCKVCGSSLFVEKLNDGVVHVRLGAFDGRVPLMPQGHAYVGSKAEWDSIADDLPRFEGVPPSLLMEALQRKEGE